MLGVGIKVCTLLALIIIIINNSESVEFSKFNDTGYHHGVIEHVPSAIDGASQETL